MAGRSSNKGKGSLPEKREMTPVPKESREVWLPGKKAEIQVPVGYRKRWTDEDTETVISATPEDYSSYEELANALSVPRTPGAVRLRKDMAIRLLDEKEYALTRANSGEHKYHDWGQVYRVLLERGYFDLPLSRKMHFARHLRVPSASWRGDGTQTVLHNRNLNKLDTRKAVQELIQRKVNGLEHEQ